MQPEKSHPILATFFLLALSLTILAAAAFIDASFMAVPRGLVATGIPFFVLVVPSFFVGCGVAFVTVIFWRELSKLWRWLGLLCPTLAVVSVLIGTIFDAMFYGG